MKFRPGGRTPQHSTVESRGGVEPLRPEYAPCVPTAGTQRLPHHPARCHAFGAAARRSARFAARRLAEYARHLALRCSLSVSNPGIKVTGVMCAASTNASRTPRCRSTKAMPLLYGRHISCPGRSPWMNERALDFLAGENSQLWGSTADGVGYGTLYTMGRPRFSKNFGSEPVYR